MAAAWPRLEQPEPRAVHRHSRQACHSTARRRPECPRFIAVLRRRHTAALAESPRRGQYSRLPGALRFLFFFFFFSLLRGRRRRYCSRSAGPVTERYFRFPFYGTTGAFRTHWAHSRCENKKQANSLRLSRQFCEPSHKQTKRFRERCCLHISVGSVLARN